MQEDSSGVAFVAGATGYTGREVVKVLAERGIRVVAHVRPDSSRLMDWRKRFSLPGVTVDTTPWDEEAMSRTLEQLKPTLVFALLGTTRDRMAKAGDARDEATYEAVDFGLTALLIRATAKAAPEARFVYLSAMGTREGARSAYFAARWKAETALRESGLAYTIARPGFVSGPDRDESRVGERVGAVVSDRVLGLLGRLGAKKLEQRYRSVSGIELAQALVRLALDPEAEGREVESEDLHVG